MRLINRNIVSITVAESRRAVQPDVVARLCESIEQLGLLQPIVISSDGELVAGRHRLEAVKRLGWKRVAAYELRTTTVDQELATLDENLIRAKLSPLEEAEWLARRKVLWELKHPNHAEEAHREGCRRFQDRRFGRRVKAGVERVKATNFAEETAEVMGVAPSSINYRVRRATRIAPDVKEEIRKRPELDRANNLDALAKMSPEDQRKVVRKAEASDEPMLPTSDRVRCMRCECLGAVKLYVPINDRCSRGVADVCPRCLSDALRYLLDSSDEALKLFERWSRSGVSKRKHGR